MRGNPGGTVYCADQRRPGGARLESAPVAGAVTAQGGARPESAAARLR